MRSAYRSTTGASHTRRWCRAALERWPLPHVVESIDTSLGQTQVVSAGSGPATCLYLPGTNFNAATSGALVAALALRCRIHVADLPGQPGLSDERRPVQEVSGYAAWVRELVTWVRTQRPGVPVVLAGHSRGAAVALSADPVDVDGLALLSPAGLTQVRPSFAMLGATVPWLVRRNPAGARRLLDFMSGPGRVPSAELVDWMTVVARWCRTTGAPDPLPDVDLARWRGHPMVVAVGDSDAFFPAPRLAVACRTLLGVEALVVPRTGHLLVEEEPDLVARLVSGLVDDS
ncbi:conserved hypothetical protein [metagenome]|uniref:AB hydrolase-1 domain-containing protein n=1 Tax=metagenome TaxID=256318 RepID=A0A2P2CDC9_9ZZZZ